MKKSIIISVAVLILALVTWCIAGFAIINKILDKLYGPSVISSLPDSETEEHHHSDGFQDYTKYCKYYFDKTKLTKDVLDKNEYLMPVKRENVKEIESYFENFEGWVELMEFKDEYDFKKSYIDEEDYYYIENKYTLERYKDYQDEYSAYNVYFLDFQSGIMYVIHSNT